MMDYQQEYIKLRKEQLLRQFFGSNNPSWMPDWMEANLFKYVPWYSEEYNQKLDLPLKYFLWERMFPFSDQPSEEQIQLMHAYINVEIDDEEWSKEHQKIVRLIGWRY